jgi:hypothetical protein
MRKSFDGLLARARQLGIDPYEGSCVVFMSRSRVILKAIVGDKKGVLLLCRRFEGSALSAMVNELFTESVKSISQAQMMLLFEGFVFTLRSETKDWNPRP